jgi:hypothetical protein
MGPLVLSLVLSAAPFAVSTGTDSVGRRPVEGNIAASSDRAPRDARAPIFIAPRGYLEFRVLGSRLALALEGDVSRLLDTPARRLLVDAGARLFVPSRFDFGLALRVLSIGEYGAPGFLPGFRVLGFEASLRTNLF